MATITYSSFPDPSHFADENSSTTGPTHDHLPLMDTPVPINFNVIDISEIANEKDDCATAMTHLDSLGFYLSPSTPTKERVRRSTMPDSMKPNLQEVPLPPLPIRLIATLIGIVDGSFNSLGFIHLLKPPVQKLKKPILLNFPDQKPHPLQLIVLKFLFHRKLLLQFTRTIRRQWGQVYSMIIIICLNLLLRYCTISFVTRDPRNLSLHLQKHQNRRLPMLQRRIMMRVCVSLVRRADLCRDGGI